eukprot:jgi/Botrbrau1/13168/Bobra.242_1s0005.1
MNSISIANRALLLRRGLGERVAGVAASARLLLLAWLERSCGGDVLDFLDGLDVETYEETARQALEGLHAEGALHPLELAQAALENGTGLRRSPGDPLLSPEEALLWRVVCQLLQQEGTARGRAAAHTSGAAAAVEAAAADDHLQALEAALPETAERLMHMISELADAGPDHRFAAGQLLLIASTCMDLSDACGHTAAAELIARLLSSNTSLSSKDAAWGDAVMVLANQVYVNPADLAGALLGQIAAALPSRTDLEQGSGGERDADAWMHCLCLASLLLKNVPSLDLNVPPAGPFSRLGDLFEHLIFPVLPHGSLPLRAEAARALGLLGLLLGSWAGNKSPATAQSAQLAVTMLFAAVDKDEAPVRLLALKALCDLALSWGPSRLDTLHMGLVENPEDCPGDSAGGTPMEPLLDRLLASLEGLRGKGGGAQLALAEVAAEGLAKLLLHRSPNPNQDLQPAASATLEEPAAIQVLGRLLAVFCDPATQEAAHARQCLSVFFPTYARVGPLQRRLLASAALPGARRSLGTSHAKAAANATQLLKYVLHVLQDSEQEDPQALRQGPSGEAGSRPEGAEGPLEQLLAEVIHGACDRVGKPYLAALLKLAAGLSVNPRTRRL